MGIISIIDVDVFIIDVWCQPYGIANGRTINKKNHVKNYYRHTKKQ